MTLPFTAEQFFSAFASYNEAVWPAQVGLTALALLAVALVFVAREWSGVAIALILATLWAWLGVAYHLAHFSRINPLAYAFGAISVAGSAVFLWQGVITRRLRFAWSRGWRGVSGVALVLYALVVYPLWSQAAGHAYPAMPTFGLPCPTTIFTIGVLVFLVPPHPRAVFAVPVLWSAVGAQAAFLLQVPPDLGLIPAGVVGLAAMMSARATPSAQSPRN